MGAEHGEEFGRRNAVEGVLLVRVRMTKVVAFDDVTSMNQDLATRRISAGHALSRRVARPTSALLDDPEQDRQALAKIA